jgi:hypothetical protein
MTYEEPKIVFMDNDPDREPQPFPIFFSCQQPRTDQQIKNTARRWEADAVFGFYKLKLSAIDEVKMLSYLDSEISADQLIQRFVSMT